jgi:hypothetical protein
MSTEHYLRAIKWSTLEEPKVCEEVHLLLENKGFEHYQCSLPEYVHQFSSEMILWFRTMVRCEKQDTNKLVPSGE